MIKGIVTGLVVGASVMLVIIGYGFRCATRPPGNDPASFPASKKTADKIVVCIGDSITHGRVSHNYVDELADRHREVSFVNAGINSQLAYNVLQRLDEVVSCNPDLITILIGTNDVQATLNEDNTARFVKKQHLPRVPDPRWYEENLTAIIDILQKKTTAKIALLSLPPITEDSSHEGYKQTAAYSEIIRRLAGQRNLTYLPLNESMDGILKKKGGQAKSAYVAGDRRLLYRAIFSRYILGRSWDEISGNNGFALLTDNLHLNGRGARIAAELIDGFLAESL